MRDKRIWVRTLIRIFYAGGIVFLVSGLLLSAISFPVLAASGAASGSGKAGPSPTPCNCKTFTPVVLPTNTPGGTSPSSLIFTSGCNCSCTEVQATVCNVGGDMKQAVNWDLYYSPNGNPALGTKIKTGKLGPLTSGVCTNLTYAPSHPGNYSYVVKQEAVHQGPGTVWSNACLVSGACFPNTATPTKTSTPKPATSTPTGVATKTSTPIGHPTITKTAAPIPYNLSAVCDYPSDNFLLWKVANHTDHAIDYTWQVVGSDEGGSGHVEANSDDYFTSTPGQKTVRLFVNDKLADTQPSMSPCKQDMNVFYVCTPNGLDWFVRNPNDFNVTIRWKIDDSATTSGVLAANQTLKLTSSTSGTHKLDLEWMDTRPVTHKVSLSSTPAACAPPLTPTLPTATATITETVTPTNTQPVITFTPTPTNTQPVITLTPTPTNTQPVITLTPTPTNTQPVITLTPTPTNTQPVITLTPTPTNTQPVITLTPTPTNTQPVITFTPTPTNTQPVITFTPTVTNTVPVFTFTPTVTRTSRPGGPGLTTTPSLTPFVPSTFTATVVTSTVTITPTNTQIVTLAPPAQVSTPAIIPVTGEDMLLPARTTNLLGKLFINIGLVLFGVGLALNGVVMQMRK